MKKSQTKENDLNFERPLVTVDVVIFTVMDQLLKVLLVRRLDMLSEPYPQRLALPGGFINTEKDHSLYDCAIRKLKEKTGVTAPYLEQLGSWGSAGRDPRGWSTTHAYFALIPAPENIKKTMADGSVESEWSNADDAASERLAFDHSEILTAAISRLRSKVEYTSLPAFLLKEPFTLPDLQHVYEIVLGRPVDKSAFRKRMMDAEFLCEEGMVTGGYGRAAMGYRIKNRNQATLFPRTFRINEWP